MTIENELFSIQNLQQEYADFENDPETKFMSPELVDEIKKEFENKLQIYQQRIRRKQNIADTVNFANESSEEAYKAKRQQERAEMNPVERGLNAVADYSAKTIPLAGELASNIALGGGGFLARSAGNLTGWKGLETIGEKTMQANRDFKNWLDIENSFPSYFEGNTDHEWNSAGGATQNVIGGVGKFMEGYHEFAPLGLATSGVGAGIGMAGKALGAGEKAVKAAQATANLGLFASSNVANTSDYIEQTSGKFKPIQSGVSSAASALAMEIAFALGRGRGMNDVEASNYATRMLAENQFAMMGKKAFKQSFATAIANGLLNGGVGTWIREEFALPDNPTQEDYDRLAGNVWEAIKHETAQGAIWGGFGAIQYHNEVRKLFNQLGGKKTITTPDGKKRSVYKTNASARFISENSEKLQKEKFPNLFETGSIEEVNSYLDELFKSVPEKLILGKSAEFGEQKENFKAALLREYNLAYTEFNSNSRFAPKIRNAKENKEAQTVNSLMANKVKGLYSQYVAAKEAIKNIDIEIEASKEDLQKQQELARQKEELQLKSYALTTQLEKPYSVYDMVGFIRNALEKQYGQMPEFMKRVDDVLSKYMSDNWHTPISADEAMGVYNHIAGELSKLDTRNVYDDYNSKINNIVNFGQPTVYGQDNRPSSVIENQRQEPLRLGYDNIVYGNDERNIPKSLLPNNTQQPVMLQSPQNRETPLLEYKPMQNPPRSVMDISQGSNQPLNALNIGEKITKETPSSFGISGKALSKKESFAGETPKSQPKTESAKKENVKSITDKKITWLYDEYKNAYENEPQSDKEIDGSFDNYLNNVIKFQADQIREAEGTENAQAKTEWENALKNTQEVIKYHKEQKANNVNITEKGELKGRDMPMSVSQPSNEPMAVKKETNKPSGLSKEAQKQYDFVKDLDPWEFEGSQEGEINLKTIDDFKKTLEKESLPKAEKDKILAEVNDLRERTEKRVNKLKTDEAELAKKIEEERKNPRPKATKEEREASINDLVKKMFFDSDKAESESPKPNVSEKATGSKKPTTEESSATQTKQVDTDTKTRESFGISDKTPQFKQNETIGIKGTPQELRISKDGRMATDNKMLIIMNEGESIPKSKDKEILSFNETLENGGWQRVVPQEKTSTRLDIPIPFFKANRLKDTDSGSDINLVIHKNGSAYLVNTETGDVLGLSKDKGLPMKGGRPVEGAVFNGKAVENINKILGGDLKLALYQSPNYPVLFEGKKGKAVLMPRYDDDVSRDYIYEYANKKGSLELLDKTEVNKEHLESVLKNNKGRRKEKIIERLDKQISKLEKELRGVYVEDLHHSVRAEYEKKSAKHKELLDLKSGLNDGSVDVDSLNNQGKNLTDFDSSSENLIQREEFKNELRRNKNVKFFLNNGEADDSDSISDLRRQESEAYQRNTDLADIPIRKFKAVKGSDIPSSRSQSGMIESTASDMYIYPNGTVVVVTPKEKGGTAEFINGTRIPLIDGAPDRAFVVDAKTVEEASKILGGNIKVKGVAPSEGVVIFSGDNGKMTIRMNRYGGGDNSYGDIKRNNIILESAAKKGLIDIADVNPGKMNEFLNQRARKLSNSIKEFKDKQNAKEAERQAKAKAEQEKAKAELEAENNSYGGFLDGKKPFQQGAVKKALEKKLYDKGVGKTAKEWIDELADTGELETRVYNNNGKKKYAIGSMDKDNPDIIHSWDVGKTVYDYAKFKESQMGKDGIQQSRTKNKATNPVTDKDLNNFLRGQAKKITKETGLNFKVVNSVDELRKMFPDNDIADTVEGGIHKDTVYLVKGNINKDRLPLVIAHEVAGHRGVESLFENKQQMDNFFNSLERASAKDKFIREAFEEVDRLGYKENRSREAMAKIVEKVRNESGTLKGTAKTFVNFITSRVRRFLRKLGFKNLQLNEAEVYDLAVQALRRTGLKNSNKFFGLDRFLAKDNSFLSAKDDSLKSLGMSERNGKASWSNDRINYLIDEYGSKSDDRYSQAYATTIDPVDFLKLTLGEKNYKNLWKQFPENFEVKDLNPEKLKGERQTPFLIVEGNAKDPTRIIGHEGRHRLLALAKAGIKSVPVVIIDKDTKYNKEVMPPTELKNQKGQNNSIPSFKAFTKEQMIPIKESNRETLKKMFGGESDIQFSIGGERAKTANIAKLEEAKKRLKDGEDKQKVWRETGWYIAKDGKPRFEISDRDFKLNQNVLKQWFEDDKAYITPHTHVDIRKLSDLIDHKQLFEAYPELKDYSVYLYDSPSNEAGSFNIKDKTIEINMNGRNDFTHPNRFAREDATAELKKVVIHELQHAIQQKENFAKGTNVEAQKRIIKGEYSKKMQEAIDSIENQEAQQAAMNYRFAYYDYLREQKNLAKNSSKENQKNYEESYKNFQETRDKLLESLSGKKLNKESPSYKADMAKLYSENIEIMNAISKGVNNGYGGETNDGEAYARYSRYYGEGEARAVERRLAYYDNNPDNHTEVDKINKNNLPESDFDYDVNNSIVNFKNTSSKSESRKKSPIEDVASKASDEMNTYPRKRNAMGAKKVLDKNFDYYEKLKKGTFKNKKLTDYKASALKASYLTGYDTKEKETMERFRAIGDFNKTREAVREYIDKTIPSDKRARLLDSLMKQKTTEGIMDIAGKASIEKERAIRNSELEILKQNLKDLKANKISTEHSMLKLDALSEALTQEELDGLLNTNDFSTGAVKKMYKLLRTAKESLKVIESDEAGNLKVPDKIKTLASELDSTFRDSLLGDDSSPSMKVSVETLAKLNHVLKDIKDQSRIAKVNLAKDATNEAYEAKEKIVNEFNKIKPVNEAVANSRETNRAGLYKTHFKPISAMNTLDLDNFTSEMGETMNKVAYKDMLAGQKRKVHHLAKGYRIVDDIIESFGKNKEDGIDNLNKTFTTVETADKHKYDITRDEAMAIYAMSTDRETQRIIKANKGLTLYLGDKKGSDSFTLSLEKLNEIANNLTAKEKEAVMRVKKSLAQDYLPELNAVHERLNGVPLRLLVDETYFPRTYMEDSTTSKGNGVLDGLSAPYVTDSANADYASLLKHRGEGAQFRLRGLTKTYENYVDQASNYIGMAEPLKKFNRILDKGMEKEITQRYGAEYVDRLKRMTELNAGMAGKTKEDQQVLSRYLSNIAAAKLTPVSALKQFSSVPLASSVIPFKYLAKAMVSGLSKENIAEMMKIDDMVLRYRDNALGGIMPLNATNMEAERNLGTFRNKNILTKPIKWGLNLSLEADKRALGIIYKATKLMAEAQGRGNDSAYIENKFMEAVRRTQNTTDLASATGWQELSRKSSHWAFLNMYLNQTQKLPNEYIRLKRMIAQAEKTHGKDSAQYKEAKGNMVNFIIGMGLMNAMTIGMGAGASAILHKKDEDKTARETAAEMATDSLFNFVGNPILKPALGGSGYVLQKALPKSLGGKGKRTTNEAFGNDFSNLLPDATYTMGRVFEDLDSDEPAMRKLKKVTQDMLGSKSVESALAIGRVPTWYARYIYQLSNRFSDDSKTTKKPTGSTSLFKKRPQKKTKWKF